MVVLAAIGCQRVVVVCGCAGSAVVGQVSSGSDRMRPSAVLNVVAHGQRAGSRRTHRRLRLMSRPGRASRRERTVRVTVSWVLG